ncbi:DUF7533 family protein [Natrarchaeobius oligotrophus]|uniref:Uncharacterized protein n=1 Tax=Natrarchaeobius chitinivorans TaxID=1679083 RepID=A0A3N6PNT9_NATCH|nr:hypothetical protein [Natrarchaeobius chitinivorans]RQH03370.1 hypothetical protein EA472_02035 [Natrarchaeobius chitinivorans]
MGIIDTIKLAGVLVFAIPAALAGLEFLLVRGEPVTGAILLGLSIALVVVQRRLSLPSPREVVASRLTGSVDANEPSDADER